MHQGSGWGVQADAPATGLKVVRTGVLGCTTEHRRWTSFSSWLLWRKAEWISSVNGKWPRMPSYSGKQIPNDCWGTICLSYHFGIVLPDTEKRLGSPEGPQLSLVFCRGGVLPPLQVYFCPMDSSFLCLSHSPPWLSSIFSSPLILFLSTYTHIHTLLKEKEKVLPLTLFSEHPFSFLPKLFERYLYHNYFKTF